MNTLFEDRQKTYSAFQGAEMFVCIDGGQVVHKLQGITVSITREMLPVFKMGNSNPVEFIKGKRAIAGNLVFYNFKMPLGLTVDTEFDVLIYHKDGSGIISGIRLITDEKDINDSCAYTFIAKEVKYVS